MNDFAGQAQGLFTAGYAERAEEGSSFLVVLFSSFLRVTPSFLLFLLELLMDLFADFFSLLIVGIQFQGELYFF